MEKRTVLVREIRGGTINIKKISIFLFIFFGALLLAKFILFSQQRVFEGRVINPMPASITDLKCVQDWGVMHGARIFSFRADHQDIEAIIHHNGLKKFDHYQDIPDSIKSVVEDRFNKVMWWEVDELKTMSVFGILKDGEREWEAMVLFTDGSGNVYLIDI